MFVRSSLAASSIFLAVLLTGCSTSFNPTLSGALPVSSAAISGNVHGGRQPIVGAHVYLLEANTTAYAGSGIAASTSNASKSLLTSGDGTDSIGTYVLTNSTGGFSVSNKYSCDTGAQVYLYSLGGMPDGVNNNSSAGLMAVLGTCGTDFSASTTVNMNELSTIAAAYAFAGFATDATHVGAPSATDTLAATGIKNAFANAQQVFDISTNPYTSAHSAPAATKYGSGTVPQQQVNTLANIIAACVNTASSGGTQCNTLFSGLMSGGATGSPATDTATEAIYMAQNPGVTSVYSVTGTGPNPYSPWDSTAAPSDLTIALTFPFSEAAFADIAADGSVWVAGGQTSNASVTHLSSLGVPFTGAPYTDSSLAAPAWLAIDSQGNAFVADVRSNRITRFSVSATPPTISSFSVASYPSQLAVGTADTLWLVADAPSLYEFDNQGNSLRTVPLQIGNYPNVVSVDGAGDVWTTSFANGTYYASKYDNNGTPICVSPSFSIGSPAAVKPDHNGNVWIPDYFSSSLVEISSTCALLTPAFLNAGGTTYDLFIDGSGNLWTLGGMTVFHLDGSGNLLAPTSGFDLPSTAGNNLAVDGSGNLWVPVYSSNQILEFLGLATPVVTPVAVGSQTNRIAQRP